MGLSIFVLIKRLRISWFLRHRFCGRSRNLEFTIIDVAVTFSSNPWYMRLRSVDVCIMCSVIVLVYAVIYFARVCYGTMGFYPDRIMKLSEHPAWIHILC